MGRRKIIKKKVPKKKVKVVIKVKPKRIRRKKEKPKVEEEEEEEEDLSPVKTVTFKSSTNRLAAVSHVAVDKWPKGKILSSRDKLLLINIVNYLRQKDQETSATKAAHTASEMTGVGWHTIYDAYRQKSTEGKTIATPKSRPNSIGKRKRLNVYDGFTLSSIRNIIHNFFRRNELPTTGKILQQIKLEPTLPPFKSRTTLYMIIRDLGFKFIRRCQKSILIERDDIVKWRRDYLRTMQKHRAMGKHVVYVDETWMNIKPTKAMAFPESQPKAAPSGKETGLIVIHAGSARGFINGACDVFQAKRNRQDSHEGIDGDYFEKWFSTQLIPNLPINCVLVMDNAPHHCVKVEALPSVTSSKEEVREWLKAKGISWEEDMLKSELLLMVNNVKHIYNAHKIDMIAQTAGHVVVRQPPFHCEFNPMEQAWNLIKRYVAMENKTFLLEDVKNLTISAVNRVSPDEWARFVQYSIERERMMWDADWICDSLIDKELANAKNVSSSESSDEDSDASGCDQP